MLIAETRESLYISLSFIILSRLLRRLTVTSELV
jgi:hypothetical protein